MVDRFSIDEFNSNLPGNRGVNPKWKHIGLYKGEHCWYFAIPGNPTIGIMIRSSIGANGFSDPLGKDSIRMHLCVNKGNEYNIIALVNTKEYITRVPGWARRIESRARELFIEAKKIKCVPHVGEKVYFVNDKNKSNYGRPFGKLGEDFRWLDIGG